MPAPEPVAAALAAASGVHRALQDADVPMLAARATLLRSVDFEESGSYRPELRHALKAKYLLLRPNSGSDQSVSNEGRNEENSLPSPKNVLFPVSSVQHGWRQGWQVGSGMQNMGNTCYLNSTLQALFHVSPFANWLISDSHSEKCCQNGGCVICGMRKTLIETQNAGGSIKPWQVYSKLRQICRHLIPGRQEDAHEFLRYLVEAMEKSYLSQYDGTGIILDQYSKETTPLNQILGGYLRSVVRCLACRRDSTTFQHFQDLLVDARKASAIDEALETFFSLERLEDLGYKCEFCNKKVSATKQFFIERAPMVLCIALKRFSLTGGKLTKHVQFKPKLSLNKHMFNSKNASPLEYRLVSVVTHLGQSQNCGHYTAVGLGPGGTFYQFDDSCVREISINAVLNTNAYIMFYELITSSNNMNKNNISSTPLSSSQSYKDSKEIISNFIGPLMPKNLKSIDDVNKSNFASSTDTDQEKLSLNGSKPKAFMSLNFRSSENNHNDSSREKTIANFSLSKLNEQKSNGTSKLNNYNKTSHCNTNVQIVSTSAINSNAPSSSKMLNGSNKASLVNSMAHSNPSLNDKMVQSEKRNISNGNLILNSEQKSDNSQNSEQKVNGAVFKLVNGNHRTLCDSKSALSETINGCGTQKLVNGTDLSELNSSKFKSKSSVTNGSMSGISPLVPYDSESSGENQDDYEDDKSNSSAHQKNSTSTSTITNSTSQGWRVSHKSPESRHSPIQHRNSNNKSSSENREQQPSTSIESKDKNTVGQLQRLSHRGYGGPVNTWAGTHAQLNRQVFDDKKSELKRAAEADDEMDRGRSKKVRHNNYGYHNGRNNNSYNAFQATQNQIHKWGSNGKSFRKFNNYNKSFKHKSRGRFNSQYPRHSNNHHYNNQYHRNH